MTAENGSRPTAKALALAAIQDAIGESTRAGGPRPVVLAALLEEARAKVADVQELVRARRTRATKAPA